MFDPPFPHINMTGSGSFCFGDLNATFQNASIVTCIFTVRDRLLAPKWVGGYTGSSLIKEFYIPGSEIPKDGWEEEIRRQMNTSKF